MASDFPWPRSPCRARRGLVLQNPAGSLFAVQGRVIVGVAVALDAAADPVRGEVDRDAKGDGNRHRNCYCGNRVVLQNPAEI
jgi:hypothetical protein